MADMNWTVSFCELFNEQYGSADLAEISLSSSAAVYLHPLQLPLFKNTLWFFFEGKRKAFSAAV